MLRKKGLCSRKFVFRLLYRKFQILPVKTRYQTCRITQRQQCLNIVLFVAVAVKAPITGRVGS